MSEWGARIVPRDAEMDNRFILLLDSLPAYLPMFRHRMPTVFPGLDIDDVDVVGYAYHGLERRCRGVFL